MDHAEEGFGELVISGCDGPVDFQVSEHALDAVALFVEGAIVLDLHAAVRTPGDDGLDIPLGQIGADGIGIIAFVCQQGIGCAFRLIDQRAIGLAIGCFADRQVEGDWPSEGISQAVKLTGEPAPRAAKSSSMSPPFPPAAETWARSVVLSML